MMSLFKDLPKLPKVENAYSRICDRVREWKGEKALHHMIQMTGDSLNENWYLSKVHPDSREQFKSFAEELIAAESTEDLDESSDEDELDIDDAIEWVEHALVGSPKQIGWAQSIASNYLPQIQYAIANKTLPTKASWWIDNRNNISF